MMKGDKIVVYLFYDNKATPDIFKWKYLSKFHFDSCLKGYFVLTDKKGRTPNTLICYVKGKHFATMVKSK